MPSATDTRKRKGPLFWVLTGGVLFLVLLFGGILGIAYRSGTQQKKEAGESAFGAMRSSVLSIADNEILEENPTLLMIHFRNKKTGVEYLMTADPVTHSVKTVPFNMESAPKAPAK